MEPLRLPRWVTALTIALLVLLAGGWRVANRLGEDHYERRCVQHASDIPLCSTGYAAEARRKCEAGLRPPDGLPTAQSMAACVRAWLAYEKK